MVALNELIVNRSTNTKPSWLVIREACEEAGVKYVAAQLGLSTASVYKHAEPPTMSGGRNPLDVVKLYIQATGKLEILEWLCREFNGTFTPNPVICQRSAPVAALLTHTHTISAESSEFMLETLVRMRDGICADDAKVIRDEFEDVKQEGERFVVACERGAFAAPV